MKRSPAGSSRPCAVEEHPFSLRQTILVTAALRRLYAEARVAVKLRLGGLFVGGESGSGKTFAANFLSQELEHLLPGLRPLVINTHTNQGASARNFYSLLVGDPSLVEKRPAKAKSDVTQRLIDRGRSANNLVVAVIDEVQALNLTDLLFLRDISNELERLHVWLFTVMLGEKPSVDVFAHSILANLPTGVADRFLWRTLSLRSPSCVGEIRGILEQLDKREDIAGWPTTRFFFPTAYDGGFRLASQASHVAAAYKDNVLATYELFNTRQLFAGLRAALVLFSDRDAKGWALSEKEWNTAFATAARAVAQEEEDQEIRVKGLPT